ncbi:nudix hydrolase 15, mitochondrial-like isoform X1 [Diospyros lotus]|uniref:nudix hydrolase 15, mitochondrial-like isoform X1 n=1 Tax=Diospyros lotus TaxID=55363 RepID=UPI002250C5FB|nr:nudix hydrolase 15, mitochondrial-like isoform X1 [Diospyros lotus]
MKSENYFHGSQGLGILARRLQQYKPTPTFTDVEAPKVPAGSVESANPVIQQPQRVGSGRAAVLICLFEGDDGDLRVILTKRSSRLSTHSGEVALPGGKAEEGDADDVETAIREAKEEIGLDPSLVNVVTVLEPFLSKYCIRVTPVIGILYDKRAFSPTPDVAEVEEVFDVPLEMFIKVENWRANEIEWMGAKHLLHYFDYETDSKEFVIWGLTARILIRAASIVYQRPPAFLDQISKYKMSKL